MKKYIIIFIILGVSAVGYLMFSGSGKPKYDFIIVERGDVIQQVSVTGRVEPTQTIDLAFEKSGKVASIKVDVGDKVAAGQTLLELDNGELSAQLLESEADLKTQQAELDELLQGTRSEEIEVQKAKVQSATISVKNSEASLLNKIKDSYTKAEDAVRNKADQFFDNPRSTNPDVNIQVTDTQFERDLNSERVLVEGILTSWESSLEKLDEVKSDLEDIRSFLEKVALAVNALTPTQTLSLTTINTYKSDISTARTNVNTAITNLLAAEETLEDGQASLFLAEKQLELEEAGSTPEQILAQEAQVEAAQANVKNYQAQISKTIIRSPISGVITRQDAKLGEIVSANTILVSVISAGSFEIKANVPEADIAKVEISDTAQVTLDAYSKDIIFGAKVVKIDPAETVIEGVSTYKVTLHFDKEDNRLRPGMTANIDILTAQNKNVLAVPQRAVFSRDGEKTVKILEGKEVKEVQVVLGLKGIDGNVEISEGIKEGDKVITFWEEK